MKKATFRIFITVLITGLIGILGEIYLKYNIDRISDNYQLIVNEIIVNQQFTTRIKLYANQHLAIVTRHVIAENEETMDDFESDAEKLEEQLLNELSELGKNMEGEEREQIYHKVYSGINSYLRNAETAMKFSRGGSKATAAYYCNEIMNKFIADVHESIQEIDEFTTRELEEAYNRMEQSILLSKVGEIVSISAICIALIFCMLYCVGITSKLDHYKEELEREIEKKNQDIQEHNEKTITIQNNTIIGMANLIENRDGDTGEHIKRTSGYVSLIANAAREVGYCEEILTDEYIELLAKAAPLHDIGKIVVPDSILKKPGKLSAREFEVMKLHASEGGKIVKEVFENIEEKEYVDIAGQVAACHHEKWDGSGYPKGLKGEDIPLCARIMAIADVFDALVSKRCYKEEMNAREAFEIIRESAGTHFDPELVRIFLSKRNEVLKVMSEK